MLFFFFFFQAEDGIRDVAVTGVQTCALPIWYPRREDDDQTSVNEEVRAAARSYQESWNRSADPFVGLVKGFAETAADAGGRLFSGVFGRRDAGGNGGRDEDSEP